MLPALRCTAVLSLLATAVLLGLSILSGPTEGEAGSAVTPPNVVVIMTDDQRADTLQFMPQVQSLIANQGTSFTNALATTSLCCPSRASFLTGRYAHNHGVLDNTPPNGSISAFDNSSTLATWLDDAGYTTALVGKYLNQYQQQFLEVGDATIPPGWDEWFAFQEGYGSFILNDNGAITNFSGVYSTDVLRDEAVEFINASLPGDPFFLLFTPYAPHAPATPAARHSGTCNVANYRPPSFNEADVSDKPAWVRDIALRRAKEINKNDQFRRDQICSLKAVDEAVAEIMEALAPELANTLVIYTSDNGYMWLEHRLKQKNCVYEECIRVPLLIRYPDLAQGTDTRLALNIDLAPTILDAAGLAIPPGIDGKSIFSLSRNDFLIEVLREGEGIAMEAVRTTRYLYNELDTGEVELYDLRNDPGQLVNIAGRPKKASLVSQLAARLDQLRLE
jgi:N-acetylglucosamine-6-sulfatase